MYLQLQLVQGKIEYLTEKLENTSYVTSSLYTESWLRSFLSFIERNNEFLNVTIDNEDDFINALKEVNYILSINTLFVFVFNFN